MTIDSKGNYTGENGEIDVNRLVLSTAITSAFRIFIFATLVFVLFLGVFPLKAMQFYESLGLRDSALHMVNIYIDRHEDNDATANSNYANALYYKMMLAEELYHESSGKSMEYLEQIYDSTYKYSQLSGAKEKYNEIDKSNLDAIDAFAHANVFSFRDRVCNLNYFAAVRLGKSEFLIGDRLLEIDEVTAELNSITKESLQLDFETNNQEPVTALRFAIFFGQISEFLLYNSSLDGGGSLAANDFVYLMDMLEEKIDIFEDFALNYPEKFQIFDTVSEMSVRQTQLYLVRKIALFYDNMYEAAQIISHRQDEWDGLRQTNDLEGNAENELVAETLTDYYYKTLLPKYIIYYAGVCGNQ